MLAPLNNEIVFKIAFQNKIVFTQFVKDIIGIDFEGKIETEKRFIAKHSNIDFKLDIFAESSDKRVIIEIQRIAYDYHFDRFLGNFLNTITEQQQSSSDYTIQQEVYSIIVLTTPYKIDARTGMVIDDEYLIQNLDPENLQKQRRPIFGHKQIFLNPYYLKSNTPNPIKDWLVLINESIKNPENYQVNEENIGIRTAVSLIEKDSFDSETWHKIKIANETRNTQIVSETKKYNEGIKIGEQIGLEKGKKEGKFETAKKLKAKGMGIDLIQDVTGLSFQEIDNL
ncbi:MAG: hypothetical protein ORN85_06105, partial [Sediminibacterium sp.]|nr:hypothetical protein [Sediminibacterium sp.]